MAIVSDQIKKLEEELYRLKKQKEREEISEIKDLAKSKLNKCYKEVLSDSKTKKQFILRRVEEVGEDADFWGTVYTDGSVRSESLEESLAIKVKQTIISYYSLKGSDLNIGIRRGVTENCRKRHLYHYFHEDREIPEEEFLEYEKKINDTLNFAQ